MKKKVTQKARRASGTKALPELKLLLSRKAKAPRQPDAEALKRLFLTAWSLVPVQRRPVLRIGQDLAVDVILVTDKKIAELHAAHLGKSGATDVLSFTMGEDDPERDAFNLGEIVVSYETAAREATERALPLEEELSRYCVHGFLHLLGYLDETVALRKKMFFVQEKALALQR